ncbi:MAG: DUF1801 domain-containing protein [Chloroflexota bacterium]
MPGFDNYEDLMTQLGKHKTGKSCSHINKLADVDMDVLRELVRPSGMQETCRLLAVHPSRSCPL